MTLSRITKERVRRDIMVYDMEWFPGRSKDGEAPVYLAGNMRLVGLYDGKRYRSWARVEDFIDAVLVPENSGKWIYAHYGGMADATFLLHAICKRKSPDISVEASFSGSSAIIINVKRGEQVWHFIDSFWLLRDKLAAIGKAIGLNKKGEDYICSNFPDCGHVDELETKYLEPCSCGHPWGQHARVFGEARVYRCLGCDCAGHTGDVPHAMCVFYAKMGELKEYNERDCVILFDAIKQFEEFLWGLGGQLQMTIASCAMYLYRRMYLTEDIPTNDTVNDVARLAYTSSRVEVFQSSCRAAKYYDLNSSFPYAMTFPTPGRMRRSGIRDHKAGSKAPKFGSIYLAEADIEVPEMYLPPLPYRHDGRVFFPCGSWRSWFSNLDLELLEKRGGKIHHIYQSVEFEEDLSLRNYAIDIYEKRKAAKTPYEKLVLKYLLNSLYGKFAEQTEKTAMLLNPPSRHCPHKVKHRCASWPNCEHAARQEECDLCMHELWNGAFTVTDNISLAHEWVPKAVHITARARMNLEGWLWRAQEDIFYCDSISADRTTVLLSPAGDVVIEPVEVTFKRFGEGQKHVSGKEWHAPVGWKALAMDANGVQGWFPLKAVIRHKVRKSMWRVSNKDGQTEVTSDHGLMVSPTKSATPSEFVADDADFVKVKAPRSPRQGREIDLWDVVEGVQWPGRQGIYRSSPSIREFERDGEFVVLQGVQSRNSGRASAMFRRRYQANSPAKMSLLRVLAAYLAEGSSSINGVTTSRDMFTIAQKNKAWLDRLAGDLRVVVPDGYFSILSTGGGMWSIRAGSAPFACFFAALGGVKSRWKRLPAFVYDLTKEEMIVFWDMLIEGDGRWCETGESTYTTNSQCLAAGLSFMLDQHGIEHRTEYRADKHCWSLGTRPTGSGRNRKTTRVVQREPTEEEYVYDLSVEGANTFVDGIGRVLLHNTDSAITTVDLPSDPKTLGALKLEDEITEGMFIACKLYAVNVKNSDDYIAKHPEAPKDGAHWSAKAKGFSRMSYNKFIAIQAGQEILLSRQTRIRELARRDEDFAPVESVVRKRLVQACMSKRCMLPGGQSRPWMLEEIEGNFMRTDVGIRPAQLAMPEPASPKAARKPRRKKDEAKVA